LSLYIYRCLKIHFRVGVNFERGTENGVQHTRAWFHTPTFISSSISDIDMDNISSYFAEAVENFNSRGSGWLMQSIHEFTVCYAPFHPFQGSSYFPTPKYLADKKAIINIKNEDNLCFLYSVLAGIQVDPFHKNCVGPYKKRLSELNYKDLSFPLKHTDVGKFESINPTISVNIFLFNAAKPKDGFCPLQISKHHDRQHCINLLLIESGDVFHYTLIKNLRRLTGDRNNHQHKSWVCKYCLHPFKTEETHNNHQPTCMIHKPQTVTFPGRIEDTKVCFRNKKRKCLSRLFSM